jgi:hypothetical protein
MSTPLRKSEFSIMRLLESEFSTLCNTCDHFNACTYQDDEKGIIQCELFENESATLTNLTIESHIKEDAPLPVDMKGICMNCDKLLDCKLPKAPAGIWHCEEYE